METYTYDETLELLNAAVVKKGEDFVYGSDLAVNRFSRPGPSCHYAWDGEPDCIVGHVFAAVGVPLSEMHFGDLSTEENDYQPQNRGKYSSQSASTVIRDLALDGVVDFTPDARSLLQETQRLQDGHVPWGEAVATVVGLLGRA